MPSTYSTSMRFELIATGEQSGTWGGTTNTNVGTLLEQAIGGYQQVAMTDANYTLTTANGAPDEARNMVLRITGTLSAQRNVSCPSGIEKLYLVENATTGGQSIVFKTVSGTGVTIPNGATSLIYVNGTNAVEFIQSPVSVALGGTGATSAANARTNLGLGTAATQNTGTSGATVPLLNGTNTWSSSQTFSASINTFGSNSNPTSVYVSGGTSTNKGVFFQTTGLNRWSVFSNSVAESGAGAGSNFGIGRYDDSGAAVDSPLIINRATGVTTIAQLALTTPLAIAQGGTGATSNSAARTSLGLVIGTDVQAYDATLQSLSSLGTAANRFAYTTGVDTWAESTITAAGRAILDDADASAQRTTLGLGTISTQNSNNVSITGGAISGVTISGITDLAVADGGTGASDADTARTNLGLVIGTNVQAYDATLQSLSSLGTAADRYAYTTGVDTWAEGTITAAGRAILDDADAAAQRTTLGLGTAATLNVGTGANNVVQLDGTAKLPAVDGSQLTNISSSGRLLRAPQILTSGTSYTTPSGCNSIYVEAVGGGGGSGGIGLGGSGSSTGGGGSGGYCAKLFSVSPSTSYIYAIGAGGTAGNASGGSGGTGGNTTFTVGGTTLTAGGGSGSAGTTSSNTETAGGAGGTSSSGDLNVDGNPGAKGGNGGASFFGGAGRASTAGTSGGGGGNVTSSGSSTSGRAGGAGLIRVWEYS